MFLVVSVVEGMAHPSLNPTSHYLGGMEAEEKLSSASHDNEMLGIMASLGPSMLTTVEPV